MPTAQVLHAIAETLINPLIQLDPETSSRLETLNGQRLVIFLEEIPWVIELAFTPELSVHQFELSWQEACERNAEFECRIKSSFSTLLELTDSRQITRLIRENKLDLDGDIHIAQRVSAVFQELDIDWEEVLSHRIGDVAAYQLIQTLASIKKKANRQTEMLADTIGSALIDEKKIAVHRLQVIHFSDQINDLKDTTERLSARLDRLENK
jgi:ubiquinone biosynthesis protein UbiJ